VSRASRERPERAFELGACSAWLRTNATVLEPEVLVDDENLHELVYKPPAWSAPSARGTGRS
jgi:hypothetical protein